MRKTTIIVSLVTSDLTEVDLKQWGSQMFYELTGMNDNEELHMHVDARTGATSRLSKEALDADEQMASSDTKSN